MPINDAAVVYATNAHFLLGATTATKPTLTQITAFATAGTAITGLTELGHTSLDEVAAFGSDGGDTEVKGSLQNRSLREVLTSEAVDFLAVSALQLKDNTILSLYYGGGDATSANEFSLPDSTQPQQRAFLMVVQDASGPLGLWVPLASVRRDDTIGIPADDFATVPLRFTYLKAAGKPRATWIGTGLGTA